METQSFWLRVYLMISKRGGFNHRKCLLDQTICTFTYTGRTEVCVYTLITHLWNKILSIKTKVLNPAAEMFSHSAMRASLRSITDAGWLSPYWSVSSSPQRCWMGFRALCRPVKVLHTIVGEEWGKHELLTQTNMLFCSVMTLFDCNWGLVHDYVLGRCF